MGGNRFTYYATVKLAKSTAVARPKILITFNFVKLNFIFNFFFQFARDEINK